MRPAAWRVGLFALTALVLLALAVVLLGSNWFAVAERGLMRFERSVYGLRNGAPVVLRGVQVGQVTAVGLAPAGPGGLAMPVTADFDRALLHDLLGSPGASAGAALPSLIARGLVARLATQSLLTGLLYIDLDIDPARAAGSGAATPASAERALPLIPTEASRLQTLQSQLEDLDLVQIGRDLGEVAAASRRLLGGPDAAQLLARSASAAAAVEQLANSMQRQLVPLARSAEATLAEARRATQQIAPLTAQLGAAASQVASAASQAQALATAGLPVAAEVQRMSVELGQTAAVLRGAAAEDSALRLNADRALQDVARAARALRELGELLERHPDALLRGRAPAP